MKALFSAVVAMCILGAGLDAEAQEGFLGAKLRRWTAELKGDVTAADDGVGGISELDIDSTLGLDSKEDFNEFHVYAQLPVLGRFQYQYLAGTFEGNDLLTQDIAFGSTTFTTGTPVDTKMKWTTHTLLFQTGIKTPGFLPASGSAGATFGVKMMEIDAEVSGLGTSEEVKFGGPIPVAGMFTRMQLSSFAFIEVQVHGLQIPGNIAGGVGGLIYDFTIAVDIRYQKFFGGVGYRIFKLNIEDESGTRVDEAKFEVDITGIFFEIGSSF